MGALELINGKKPDGIEELCLAGLMSAARPVYAAGLALHRALYARGIKKSRRLPCRNVCIGNLTLGGSGKTPTVTLAARLLSKEGIRPVVISRGYLRKTSGDSLIIVSNGGEVTSDAATAGDEPVMMARSLPGVPVIACADRYRAGMAAVEKFHPDIILMDDGFQHWALERDCDIVCVNAARSLGNMKLFPRGPLREPLDALKRARGVILTRSNDSGCLPAQETLIRAIAPNLPILRLRYILGDPVPLFEKETEEPDSEPLHMKKALLFCGIADPESFFKLVGAVMPHIAGTLAFPDHVMYTPERIREIQKEFSYRGAHYLLTTEKDAVKLLGAHLARLPLYYLGLRTEFENPADEGVFLDLLRGI